MRRRSFLLGAATAAVAGTAGYYRSRIVETTPEVHYPGMQAGHALRGQRTVILVTHSLEAASGCDVIHVLDQGRVVETGTHAELIARGGLYASMATDHQQQAKRSLRFTPAASVSAAPDSPLLAARRIRSGAKGVPPS